MPKPILCLDFDGTIHSYESGWHGEGAHVILDGPVPGAFDFIRDALAYFDVHVFSSRSCSPEGIAAMKAWFTIHGWEVDPSGEPVELSFSDSKPPAHVSIDDRAITFAGVWPDIDELRTFKPWNGLDIKI